MDIALMIGRVCVGVTGIASIWVNWVRVQTCYLNYDGSEERYTIMGELTADKLWGFIDFIGSIVTVVATLSWFIIQLNWLRLPMSLVSVSFGLVWTFELPFRLQQAREFKKWWWYIVFPLSFTLLVGWCLAWPAWLIYTK